MNRIAFFVLCLSVASPVLAHEVSASRVQVHQSGNAVELWQTTPFVTAHNLVAFDLETKSSPAVADQLALKEMAMGWSLATDKGNCRLEKHAHRRVHHETQLQLRYLFTCPEDSGPVVLTMNWLDATPDEHFVFLDWETSRGLRTRIIERPKISFRLGEDADGISP